MNLIRKGHGHAHRGVIGVESAIVMIAFVIVAAALAFVVLNMGFSTTQKAKTTIISGLSEASSSLEVSGKVMGIGCTDCAPSAPKLNATVIPVKIASGGDSVNLDLNFISVKYLSNTVEYTNIYEGTLNTTTYDSAHDAFDAAVTATWIDGLTTNQNPVDGTAQAAGTTAFFFWSTTNTPQNNILDEGEHASLAIAFANADKPTALDKLRTEVIVSTGAALTVERQVPTISYTVVDMG